MKDLQEYIIESSNSLDNDIISKIDNKETVIANDVNIKDIIKYSIDKLGKYADLNFIDVSKVTNMKSLFYKSKFNGNIFSWDVSNVKYMNNMFESSKFNGDISSWNVSNVENMKYIFRDSQFNQDISKWNVSNVENMSCMFEGSKFNGDISSWNVSNVKDMFCMFDNSKFNQDISKWDVLKVITMESMFKDSQFNRDISSWNVSNVENMICMFKGSKFNQDISKWNVYHIIFNEEIFEDCPIKEEYKSKFKNDNKKETEQHPIKKTKPTLSELKEYIDKWVSDTIDGWSTSWEDNKSKRKDLSNANDWFMNELSNWLDDNGYIVSKKYIEEIQQYMLKQVKEEIKYYKN